MRGLPMTPDDNDLNDIELFREKLRALDDSFFDGHTEFSSLDPEQRLL
jgi:hypothetical protein